MKSRNLLASPSAIVAFMVLAAACAAAPSPEADREASDTPATTSPVRAEERADAPSVVCDFADRAEDVLASVHQVITHDGIGTAFYLGDDEWLTAAHVVGNAQELSLHNGPDSISATVKGIDYNADLALLVGIPGTTSSARALLMEETDETQPGETAIVVGYPLYEAESASISRGIVSRFEDDELLGQLVVTDAAANPGNSGGPMLNDCGKVIGVVIQKYVGVDVEGITYALSTESIAAALPRLRRGFQGTPPTPDSQGTVAIDGSTYSFDVTCRSTSPSEIVVAGTGNHPDNRGTVELYAEVGVDPYIGIRLEDGTLIEPDLSSPIVFHVSGDTITSDDILFVRDLDLQTGRGILIGIGTVAIECLTYEN